MAAFAAKPIQMKASSASAFGVDRRHARFADLIMAYVWHLNDPAMAVTYAMPYLSAVELAEVQGWTKTVAWEKGKYVSNKPSVKLVELLEPHRMTSEKWWKLVAGSEVPVSGG